MRQAINQVFICCFYKSEAFSKHKAQVEEGDFLVGGVV